MECPLNAGPASDCSPNFSELFKDCDRLPVLQSKQVQWQKQSGSRCPRESDRCGEVRRSTRRLEFEVRAESSHEDRTAVAVVARIDDILRTRS